jgi:hypothetical protein
MRAERAATTTCREVGYYCPFHLSWMINRRMYCTHWIEAVPATLWPSHERKPGFNQQSPQPRRSAPTRPLRANRTGGFITWMCTYVLKMAKGLPPHHDSQLKYEGMWVLPLPSRWQSVFRPPAAATESSPLWCGTPSAAGRPRGSTSGVPTSRHRPHCRMTLPRRSSW